MKEEYVRPIAVVALIEIPSLSLLTAFSMKGNIGDFTPGDDNDLVEDDWG